MAPDVTDTSTINQRGIELAGIGRLDEAIACFRLVIQIDPQSHQSHANLGVLLLSTGQLHEAIASLRTATALAPNCVEISNNLSNALAAAGDLDEAAAYAERALYLRVENLEAENALGNVRKDQGRLDESIACYQRALTLRPDWANVRSNLLYVRHFHPSSTPQSLLAEHREWDRIHARPLRSSWPIHTNSRDIGRPLRVGYVSADFREHPIGRFIRPLIDGHDRRRFEVFCYSNVAYADEMTGHSQSLTDHWRDIAAVSDDAAAELIRADRIDVLVDLGMHMRGGRPLLFARKPAPVQATYLAYCSTTGLEAMDWRLSDGYLDPKGNDADYAERTWQLPGCYWCYEPPAAAPEVAEVPCRQRQYVTFGCLNNYCKVTDATLQAWKRILDAVPGSQLIVHAGKGSCRERVSAAGIEPARVRFVERMPLADYLSLHAEIDMALDPFPCAGGTTTCDALWMGVPTITLTGQTAVGRSGVSILRHAGMGDCVTQSVEEYVCVAVELASDWERRAQLRRSMRERMRTSRLMDRAQFVNDVEAAFAGMWKAFCES